MKKTGIIGIYLAAGNSMRMGTNKLELPLGSTTLGSSALQSALQSRLDHIVVVVKEEDRLNWISSSLLQAPLKEKWTPAICKDAGMGQAHSLICGLKGAMEMDPKGVMVLLADQPYLSAGMINDLVNRFAKLEAKNNWYSFVAARFQGIARPPIIFSQHAVPELKKLKGDEGARKLIQQQKLKGIFIDYEDVLPFLDIDTQDEYEEGGNYCW